MSNKTLHSVVNGRTIELVEGLGVSVGQKVEVMVTLVPEKKLPWGEGLRR